MTYIKTPLRVTLDRIKAIMTEYRDNIVKIDDYVNRYGGIHSFADVELAGAFFFMAQSGLSVDESVELMPGFMRWAIETTAGRVQEYLDTLESPA